MKKHWTLLTIGAVGALSTVAPTGVGAQAAVGSQTRTARQWHLVPAANGQGCELALQSVAVPEPGPGEIRVRIHATSLNGRDRAILGGTRCPFTRAAAQVPLSDGAGEVVAIGPGVTRFEVGDRVVGDYYGGGWIDGDRPPEALRSRRGVPAAGMLSELVVGSVDGFVEIPDYLSYEEAATLPVAAVTAYTALFKYGGLQPNEFVLLEGTGGVSSFGLQFAVAAGARPIITSSSDDKLKKAVDLGAVGTVNYRLHPQWHDEVMRLTGGVGAHQVLEVGGEDTRSEALESMAIGGHMALIGGLTGFGGTIPFDIMFDRDLAVTAYHVGSRSDFEAMNRFMTGHHIHPIVGRVFDFEQAPEAFDFYLNGDFMGKIVIRL
jgi:NADPH:quinone reductase-like Zn-dependent oxidoreductase